MYSVKDSIEGLSESIKKLELVRAGLTLEVDKGIILDIINELNNVETALKRLKRQGVQ